MVDCENKGGGRSHSALRGESFTLHLDSGFVVLIKAKNIIAC